MTKENKNVLSFIWIFLGFTAFTLLFGAFTGLAPELQKDLKLDDAGLGVVFSAYGLGEILGPLVGGILADRKGAKPVLAASALVYVVASLPLIFVVGVIDLSITRFLHGFATAVYFAPALAWISSAFSKRQGLLFGLFFSSFSLGLFLGANLGSLVQVYSGSWRYAMLAMTLINVVVLVPLLILAIQARSGSPSNSPATALSISTKEVLKNRNVVMIGANQIFVGMAANAFLVWLTPFLTRRGLDVTSAAFLLGLLGAVLIAGNLIVGRMSDIFPKKEVAFLGGVFSALSIALFVFSNDLAGWLLSVVVVSLLMPTIVLVPLSMAADLPISIRARAVAFGDDGFYVGAAISPIVVAFLAGGGDLGPPLLLVCGVSALASSFFIRACK